MDRRLRPQITQITQMGTIKKILDLVFVETQILRLYKITIP
jgi:hypothetical protein